MPRAIKFRAWSILDRKMLQWGDIFHLPAWEIFPGTPEQRAFEVMQYTGHKDKNGVEIYEGDVLFKPSWWWGPRFVYLNVGECGPCKGDSVMSYLLAKNIQNPLDQATHNIWNGKDVEVIGNIYEQPELLVCAGNPKMKAMNEAVLSMVSEELADFILETAKKREGAASNAGNA